VQILPSLQGLIPKLGFSTVGTIDCLIGSLIAGGNGLFNFSI
jgi:hypothetical protein